MANRVATTTKELHNLLVIASELMPRAGMISNATSLDHIYPGKKTNIRFPSFPDGCPNGYAHHEHTLPIVILYAALGTECFSEFHDSISRASTHGEVVYIHRPILMHGCENSGCVSVGTGTEMLNAAGFGVELAMRNIEYKSMNDPNINDYTTSDSKQNQHTRGSVEGFNFTTLSQRFSHLDPHLKLLKSKLLQNSANVGASPEIWHTRDVCLQVTQRILSAADKLNFMVDVLHNFPSLASSLSRVHIDGRMRADIIEHQKNIRSEAHIMRLNGIILEDEAVDIFSLTDQITRDTRVGDIFHGMGMTRTQIRQLLQIQPAPHGDLDGMFPRLRLEDSEITELVIWMNDIETDPDFEHLSPKIDQFSEQGGSIPHMKRNLLNVIAIVDLSQPSDRTFVENIHRYVSDGGVPLRLGLVLVDNDTGGLQANGNVDENNYNAEGCKTPEASNPDQERDDKNGHLCLPSGLPIRTALARAGTLLLREYGGKYAAEFVRKVAMAKQLIFDGNSVYAPVYSNNIWAAAEKAFIHAFKRACYESTAGTEPKNATIKSALRLALHDILRMDDTERDGHHSMSRSARYVSEVKSAIAVKGVVVPSFLVNGLYCSFHDAQLLSSELSQVAIHLVHLEARALKRAFLEGDLADSMLDAYPDGVYGWLHRNAMSKNVPIMFSTESFTSMHVEMLPAAQQISHESLEEYNLQASADFDLLSYAVGGDKTKIKCTTIWIIADVGNAAGRALVDASTGFVHGKLNRPGCPANDVRIAVLHPPWATPTPEARDWARIFRGIMLSDDELDNLLQQQGFFVARILGLDYDSHSYSDAGGVIIVNGRVVTVPNNVVIERDDLCTLMSDQHNTIVNRVWNILHVKSVMNKYHVERQSDLCMLASSFIAQRHSSSASSSNRVHALERSKAALAAINVYSDGFTMLEVVLNPLSKHAQRIAPLLTALQLSLTSQLGYHVMFSLDTIVENLPLKSYYRYANPPTHVGKIPSLQFSALPRNLVFTVHLDVPEMWLVNTIETNQDLDNLILGNAQIVNTVEVEFRIEALMVTGHCINYGKREHPQGLQLVLGRAETLVMSNLGYFQLPSLPGLLHLTLRPGRSTDIFSISTIVEVGRLSERVAYQDALPRRKADVETMQNSRTLVVSSWTGKRVRLLVQRKEAMINENILNLEEDLTRVNTEQKQGLSSSHGQGKGGDADTILNRLKSKFMSIWVEEDGGNAGGETVSDVVQMHAETVDMIIETSSARSPKFDWRGEKIHIFSIASGHLYERFLRIMILSVRRNTMNPLKFWFVKTWLSPLFKDSLAQIALKYGFEYEFVTYKWPTWLHKQTEKQRIIWAYKLLFLDVMFPQTLNKVIFLDADQVVRADVKELWEIDLRGAPYAYTPFCDDNPEMEGFRFWKQGFWKDHLQGKPYHISALYVVDLKRFRQLAAGDHLRRIYENLSRDPNSLANLDQDLPNYAQHQVPIFSLPQHWLWCESWCAKHTKASAKTIDLCNNPMTKEHKLASASRIIAEWDDLDEEISSFIRDT